MIAQGTKKARDLLSLWKEFLLLAKRDFRHLFDELSYFHGSEQQLPLYSPKVKGAGGMEIIRSTPSLVAKNSFFNYYSVTHVPEQVSGFPDIAGCANAEGFHFSITAQ
jgi:hypothetical protein